MTLHLIICYREHKMRIETNEYCNLCLHMIGFQLLWIFNYCLYFHIFVLSLLIVSNKFYYSGLDYKIHFISSSKKVSYCFWWDILFWISGTLASCPHLPISNYILFRTISLSRKLYLEKDKYNYKMQFYFNACYFNTVIWAALPFYNIRTFFL